MPASASLSALALGEGDVEGEWRHSQETRFHSRETRKGSPLPLRVTLLAALCQPGLPVVLTRPKSKPPKKAQETRGLRASQRGPNGTRGNPSVPPSAADSAA